MQNQKGNFLILMALFCFIGVSAYLVYVKKKSIQDSDIKDKSTESLNLIDKLSSLNKSNTKNPKIEENNTIVVRDLPNDESLNPFSTIAPLPQNLDQSKNNTNPSKNLIDRAPNGMLLPNQTGYLQGYPMINSDGELNVTIDNKYNHSNIIVKLYFLRSYYNSKADLNKNIFQFVYVASGDSFTFKNLKSGEYQIEWVDLATNKAYRNKSFIIYQDNKYAYDRVLSFSNVDTSKKDLNEISINNFYK